MSKISMQEIKSRMCFELNEEDMASSSRAFRKPKNAEEERKLLESATPKSTQVSNILGPPETTGKASNAEVMGNDMESLLPADLNFEISDDVLSNMPLPDYGSNVIQNFSGSVFNNCTINFVQNCV